MKKPRKFKNNPFRDKVKNMQKVFVYTELGHQYVESVTKAYASSKSKYHQGKNNG